MLGKLRASHEGHVVVDQEQVEGVVVDAETRLAWILVLLDLNKPIFAIESFFDGSDA